MKKLLPLFTLLPLLTSLSSCSNNENRVSLAMNVDSFLTGAANEYQAPEIDKISANLEINADFAIYFMSTGCYECDVFSPIMDEYMQESKMLIYKFDNSTDHTLLSEFAQKYGEKFFKEKEVDTYITLPALAIVNNGEVEYVNRDSYMKTKNAFFNYMNSHYQTGNICYTTGNVMEKEFTNREFAYIYFNQSNLDLMNLYKTKLMNKAKNSARKVIVSNTPAVDELRLRLVGKTADKPYARLDCLVLEDTDEETIDQIL